MTRLARLAVAVCVLSTGACSAEDGPSSEAALVVAAYVAPWDPRSRAALEQPPAAVAEINPVWYRPTDGGGLTVVDESARSHVEGRVPTHGNREVRLVPSVSNFRAGRWDGDLVARILDDPARRRTHIRALVGAARRPGVAGLDLDYESLDGSLRDAYSAFVRDLAAALHDARRTLTVTVHAKTSEPGQWAGARAQDWQAIGASADAVRVMAYDHAWQGSAPGPVAPLPWVEDVVRFALDQLPPEKVVLGLPTYGYDWPDGRPGRDLAWSDADALADSRGVGARWDEESASPWFAYTDDAGTAHTVWYEDARSLGAKLDVARGHGLDEVVLWKIGGEDPAIWEVLAGT